MVPLMSCMASPVAPRRIYKYGDTVQDCRMYKYEDTVQDCRIYKYEDAVQDLILNHRIRTDQTASCYGEELKVSVLLTFTFHCLC